MLITVPMIQRDYAQGRRGKEYIRGTFLQNIRECLLQKKMTALTLDFVYGNAVKQEFFPLDGQQRLTTLWLVHWYLAFRITHLKDSEVKSALKRFRYQTRSSSTDFCERLCDEMAKANPAEVGNVAEYIKKQTWFFADWTQDPTINAMLRTLGGDQEMQSVAKSSEDAERTGNADTAHIEAIFGELSTDELQQCWENLTENKKITFELMIIGTDQLPISDDLYIKMNARGKKLTDFENFKADWVKDMRNNPALAEKIGDKTYVQMYTEKLDQDWTDVFWNSRLAGNAGDFDGNIDSIFFSFINRFVLNQLCLQDKNATYYNSAKYITTDEEIKILQKNFDILYGTGLGKKKKTNDDSLIEYKGFGPYHGFLGKNNLQMLDRIFAQLHDPATDLGKLSFLGLDEDSEGTSHLEIGCHFLPQYTESTGLVATTLKERIYFHAMCLFLEKPNWEHLEDWKRVVHNLVENAAIENLEAMIGCLREIDGLGKMLREKEWNVYDNIDTYSMKSPAGQLTNQWKEEQEKAKKMNDPIWKEKIVKAEGYAFFRGTIRFLYTGPDGNPDWDNFDVKFRNAEDFFQNKSNTVMPKTIKCFLKQFSSFDDLNDASNGKSYFFTTIGFHTRNVSWKKNILCNTEPKVIEKVHRFLLRIENTIITDKTYEQFLESSAVEYLSTWSNNYKYRYHYSKDWGILRDNHATEGIFTTPARLSRNKLLLELEATNQIQFTHDDISLGQDFLWGKEIYFTYNGKEYCWYADWNRKNWIRIGAQKDPIEWPDNLDTTTLLVKLQKLQST